MCQGACINVRNLIFLIPRLFHKTEHHLSVSDSKRLNVLNVLKSPLSLFPNGELQMTLKVSFYFLFGWASRRCGKLCLTLATTL
jgi:hypothetical protein